MAETQVAETYAEQPQLSGTGSTDSDRDSEVGQPLVTESDIAASEAARKDNPPPQQSQQEPSQPVEHWNAGLQKVQQELSARRQKEEQLAGRLDTLQDTLVQMMQQQQASPSQSSPSAEPQPRHEASDIVKSAFEDVDMLDSEAVQDAMSKVVNGVQSSPSVDSRVADTIQQMSQRIEALDRQLDAKNTSDYWKQLETQKGVTEEQRLEASARARQTVVDKGWYGENDPRFDGAVYAELEHILDGHSAKAPSTSSQQVRGPGTVVKPGASARTGPPSGIDQIPTVDDSDIWQAD